MADKIIIHVAAAFLVGMIAIVLVVMLAGIQMIYEDAADYMGDVTLDRQLCEDLGPQFTFKDETLLGYGEEDDYGCFLYGEGERSTP